MIHFMRPEEFLYQPMVLLDNRVMEYQFCMQNIQNPKGHYMEFGVFEGKSINYLASLNKKVTFHGFDSFEGLPEQWFMGHKVIEKGHFAVSELPKVVPNVVLHEGWFEDTIPTWKKTTQDTYHLSISIAIYISLRKQFYHYLMIRLLVVPYCALMIFCPPTYPHTQSGRRENGKL